jgi:hypothetical protein
MASKATPRFKCLKAIQLLARISASDENGYCTCVSCGKSFHYKEGDGGHYIPKGDSSFWALEMENIHPQCKGCNGFGMKYGTAAQEYTLYMQDMYGRKFVEEMFAKKKNVKKIYKFEYIEMLAGFNELIKHHRERIGEI